MIVEFRLRKDTAAAWATANPVLADGEPGWDKTNLILKIGDGSTAWVDLPEFVGGDSGTISDAALAAIIAEPDGETRTAILEIVDEALASLPVGGDGGTVLAWTGSAYPDRPDNGLPVIFVGPENPDDLDLMMDGDTWLNTASAPDYMVGLTDTGEHITVVMPDHLTEEGLAQAFVGQYATVDRPAAGDHPGKVLWDTDLGTFFESDGTSWTEVEMGGGGDHGTLTGLGDDDHPQYHNNARGDARYAQLGHLHASTEVTDFTEAVQDAVAAMLSAGANITLTYNDEADTLQVTAAGGDAETMRDTIGAALVGTAGVVVNVNDAADTITLSVSGLTISQVTGLQAALDSKAASSHSHTVSALPTSVMLTATYSGGTAVRPTDNASVRVYWVCTTSSTPPVVTSGTGGRYEGDIVAVVA